jgi:uncharacterized membrane protein YkvA (DUF1232 family)
MQQKPSLPPQAKAGMVVELARNVRLAWRLLRDNRVALWIKAIIPVTIVYLISPIDIIPDALLGLGQLDDLAVILLGFKAFIDLCPPEIVKEHLAEIVSVHLPSQTGPTDTSSAKILISQPRALGEAKTPQKDKDSAS